MSYLRNAKFSASLCALLTLAILGIAWAGSTDAQFYDKARVQIHTSTSDADISEAVLTSATTLLTIEPAGKTALHDVQVTFDLDKATTGWNDTHTTETIQFLVGRKVDGTNYRPSDHGKTSTITGSAANTRSITIDVGTVTPDEDCRIYIVLSAEGADFELPYVVTYRAPRAAAFTDVAN